MLAVDEVAREVGVKPVCEALGVSRASWYRWKTPPTRREPRPRPAPARALSEPEKDRVASALHEPRFVDRAPAEVYATLLDEGLYLCSERTMYRILSERGEVKERRDQLRHPRRVKPRLVASGPNQVWSWDITKLRGPVKRRLFYLFVLIDIYSRYVVGWTLSRRSSSVIAADLVRRTIERQSIPPGQVVVHGDRGTELVAKEVVHLFEDLGVSQSLSRPRVPNDNPYSESQFKTLKSASIRACRKCRGASRRKSPSSPERSLSRTSGPAALGLAIVCLLAWVFGTNLQRVGGGRSD